MSMTLREQIIETARTYVGTPYLHQGRSRSGIDCIGLVINVAATCGVIDPEQTKIINKEFNGYARLPGEETLITALSQFMSMRSFRLAEPADIIVTKFRKYPRHCMILTDKGTIIHAFANIGRVTEQRFAHIWKREAMASFSLMELCH